MPPTWVNQMNLQTSGSDLAYLLVTADIREMKISPTLSLSVTQAAQVTLTDQRIYFFKEKSVYLFLKKKKKN